MPASAPRGRRVGLEAHNQKEIHGLDRPIIVADPDGPARRRLSQELRVLDREDSAVSQMDVERLEWPCQMQTAQLFDGHVDTISAIGPRLNDFAGIAAPGVRQKFLADSTRWR